MEYLDGESLARRLQRTGRLSVTEAVDVAQQTAGAIAAAHAKDIVHRDLKPDNLFLVTDRSPRGLHRVKVLDFGIAKLSSQIVPSSVRTHTGAVMGTPAYMSPEQCRGVQKEVGYRADIYALGCILYEMLCGQPPFVSDGSGEVMVMHIAEPPRPPTLHNPVIPEHLERAVLRALAKKPEDRFDSIAQMGNALNEATWPPHPGYMTASVAVSGDASPPLRGSDTPSGRELPPLRRPRLGWAGIAAGLSAVAGGLVLITLLRRSPPEPKEMSPAPAPIVVRGDDEAAKKYLQAAESLARERRFDPALEMVERATRLSVVDPDLNIRLASLRDTLVTSALLRKAASQLEKQDWRGAIETANLALERDPQNVQAAALIGRARSAEKSRVVGLATRARASEERSRLKARAGESVIAAGGTSARPASRATENAGLALADPFSPPAPPAPAPTSTGPVPPAAGSGTAPPETARSVATTAKEPPRPSAGAAAPSGGLTPSSLRPVDGAVYSITPRSPIALPRLPRVHTVQDSGDLARICGAVESEAIAAGVSPPFASGITAGLQRAVAKGATLYPVGMYYFIVREAARKQDSRSARAGLIAAHHNGLLLQFRDLPASSIAP